MSYQVEFTQAAKADLCAFKANERKVILTQIRARLSHEPLKETRNRKKLRPNPVAAWELRVSKYRIFYEVNQSEERIGIIAVGWKYHNVLYIRGGEVKL